MNLSTIKRFLLENEHINKICASLYRMGGWNKVKKRGNSVIYNNTYLSRCTISISGQNNQIIFNGTNYFKRCKFYITGNNNRIVIGDKVCGYDATFIIEDSNGSIEVGYKTLFAGKIEIASTEGAVISVGEECLFSSEVDIRNGDSHSILDENGERINKAEDVQIGNDVWVAHRAMILKGAVILNHSVVGAGAIVTSKFDRSNVVLAGSPARIVKEKICWKHEKIQSFYQKK